jgi:formate dehydrogenase iron-sulfur subunit
MSKCTLCVDRVGVGLEPACVKACPTGCLHFGTKKDMLQLADERVSQLREGGFANAAVYDPPGVGGTGVVTVLSYGDHPEWYGLPKDPKIPFGVRVARSVLKPIGLIAIFGAVAGVFAHFMQFGPKKPPDADAAKKAEPTKETRS